MDVRLTSVTKRYGTAPPAIQDVTLEVRHGEFLVLLGPSGCGKTTTLRCIAGLEVPDQGRITIGGQPVFDSASGLVVPPERRGLGMVFQSYAIWPHMTVFENVAYGLVVRRRPRSEIRERVERALQQVGLAGLGDRPATNLSGGQMQRVALARSLVIDPAVLLLDEPLSNLDLKLRERLRVELKEIQIKTGLTMIYVTHDQTEAFALADRVVVMNAGRVVQVGPPDEVFSRPANTFVADFLGSANVLRGRFLGHGPGGGGLVEVAGSEPLRIECQQVPAGLTEGQNVFVAIRPEYLQVRPATEATEGSEAEPNRWRARVEVPNFLGTHTRYALDLRGHRVYAVATGNHVAFRPGTLVDLAVAPADVMILLE